jgi:hypothetical protein
VTAPDAVAVALRIRVENAARFLPRQLRRLMLRAQARASAYDGLYVEVDDAQGPAWISAESRLGGDDYVRPKLAACNPFPPPGPGPGLQGGLGACR